MAIDFSTCRVINPNGKLADTMHKNLWEIFPYDRPVYNAILTENKSLYSVINYALFQEDEFIGNAGLFPLKMWYHGEIIEILGIGAVATMPQYRRQGVANYLMNYCMQKVDKRNKASVLFTELPAVYEKHGFKTVAQEYMAMNVSDLDFEKSNLSLRYYETITSEQIKPIKAFYNDSYSNYDGKLVRGDEPDYWDFYLMMFNPYMKPRLVIATDESGNCRGYCRLEVETDRITVTELCVAEDDIDSCGALLGFVKDFAKLTGYEIITLVVAKEHFVWDFLKERNVEIFAEPKGVRREIFMVRAAEGESVDTYENLLWSLADKF